MWSYSYGKAKLSASEYILCQKTFSMKCIELMSKISNKQQQSFTTFLNSHYDIVLYIYIKNQNATYLPIFNHNLCISNKFLDWCVINCVHDENIVYSRIFILFISLIFEIFGTNNLIVSRRWFIGSNVNDIESHSVSKDGFIIGILSFCYL